MLKKVLAAIFVSSLLFISTNAKAAIFTNNQVVDKNKSWTIHFNQELVFDDATKNAIVVTDSMGSKVNVSVNLGSDNKSVVVGAPEVGYEAGAKYELTVGNGVHSVNGKEISGQTKMDFSIKNDIEQSGNTNGNISNGGKTCEKDGFIYYGGACSGLYKMKTDGTGKVKLLDDSVADINVVGGWIYYLNVRNYNENPNSRIYKVKIDGTCKTEIYSQDDISDLIVTNKYIYYKTFTSNSDLEDLDYAIYKMDIDGTDKVLLTNEKWISNINYKDNYIYYNTSDGIYKIKNDGTDRVKLHNCDTRFMIVNDKNIYFHSEGENYSVNNVYKMDLDGKELQKVITFNSDANELFQPFFFNVDGDWIYYSTIGKLGDGVYEVKTDGTQNTKLIGDYCKSINVTTNMLFCNKIEYASGHYDSPTFDMELYTTNKDGSQKQSIDSSIVSDN
ncbi:DUF5050 domain-containing protein [Clostridium neuense]|uniref:DUF5050 domain-containing protein n=1 Tax=Clostridium neuense TaxID=1728934 RepID=A0ABW8TGW9_9CLOT